MESIDELIDALYASISFPEGGQPPLEQLKELFLPNGWLVNNNGEVPEMYTVETFILAFRKQISNHSLRSFEEREVDHHTDLFGNIAQRFSTYEARHSPDDDKPFSRGINSIQMICSNGLWRITSMVWSDETPERPLPPSVH